MGITGTILRDDMATISARKNFGMYKRNLKYYLAILRLMCVNAILTFRAPYEKTLELAHFHTNYGKTNSLKERTSEEMSDNKVLSPDRSET
jgi:hypothetical protein